jgi:hypothetical protein
VEGCAQGYRSESAATLLCFGEGECKPLPITQAWLSSTSQWPATVQRCHKEDIMGAGGTVLTACPHHVCPSGLRSPDA